MASGRPSPVAEIAQLRSLINDVEFSTKSSRNTSPTRRNYGGGVSPTRSLHSLVSAGGSEAPSQSTSPVNANDAGSSSPRRRVSFARSNRKKDKDAPSGTKQGLQRRSDFALIMMQNTRPNAHLQSRGKQPRFPRLALVPCFFLIGSLSALDWSPACDIIPSS